MTPSEVIKFIKDKGIQVVDLKFVDLPGLWQHFSVSAREFEESAFTEGVGFDGSSIRGFQEIHESDMLLFPDPNTIFVDPFTAAPTLSLICNVADPIHNKPYSRDPRHIALKAEQHLKATGVADTGYFGPEAEFYILDSTSLITSVTTISIPKKGSGTAARKARTAARTWDTSRATRKATSRCRLWTACRISAPT